jgi:hypothetical protein
MPRTYNEHNLLAASEKDGWRLGTAGLPARRPLSKFAGWTKHLARAVRLTMPTMQLTTGTVVGGKIVVEGDPLPEGTVVTILSRGRDETFLVSAELEAELRASLGELARDETMPAQALLQRIRSAS